MIISRRGMFGAFAGMMALPLLRSVPDRFIPASAHMAFVKGELPFVDLPWLSAEQATLFRNKAVKALAERAMMLRTVADLSEAQVRAAARRHGDILDDGTDEIYSGPSYVWMRASLWMGHPKETDRPWAHGAREYHFLTKVYLEPGEDTMSKAHHNPDVVAVERSANGLIPVHGVALL